MKSDKVKITEAQLLARGDNEISGFDTAEKVLSMGWILAVQLHENVSLRPVQKIDKRSGMLHVLAGGVWCKPYKTYFFKTMAEYNTAVKGAGV